MSGRMLRTIRLDPSDTIVFERAAEPGEPAVVGGFMFWDVDPASLSGKARQAFRAGFLGVESFGWSTLVTVGSATAAERESAVATLARAIRDRFGAPDEGSARAAAEEEIAYAEGLCAGHAPGTVIALSRSLEAEVVRERFRTLSPRGAPQALPVIGLVRVEDGAEPEAAEQVDLVSLLRGGR
ncbi:MAG: DUF6505 family protein [Acetobacteraceae bacterium]